MKNLLLFILIILSQACSSKTKYDVHQYKGISPELQPFVYEFKVNHPSGSAAKTEIPMNFVHNLKSYGVCYLRADLEDREILVNRQAWESYPEKREYIMNYLLSSCYGTNALTSPHYEIHLRGL